MARITRAQARRNRVLRAQLVAIVAPVVCLFGAMALGVAYPHGAVARGLVALLKASPFSMGA